MALRTPFANDAKTYGFEWLRGLLEASLQEGVLNMGGAGTDLMVTQRAAGANMTLDIAAGAALVKGDSGTAALGISQGLFMAINDAAVTSAVTLTSDATNPKIVQVCLKIEDSSDLGSAADQVTFTAVDGTPAAGATLDNRSGAAALPNNCLRLADVLVPAAAVSVSNTSIRDRRPWARGAHRRIVRNASPPSTAAGPVVMDATNLSPRIECSGATVKLTMQGLFSHSVANGRGKIEFRSDAVVIDGGMTQTIPGHSSGGNGVGFATTYEFVPTAGSHVLAPYMSVIEAGTITFFAAAGTPLLYTIEEVVRQDANNNSVTTG